MTKPMKILLCIVLLAAIGLTAVLFLHHRGLRQEVSSLSAQLAESRAAWEKTAEEKEALQEDLKVLKNDLKEAELTISESAERAESLWEDIAALREEISALE